MILICRSLHSYWMRVALLLLLLLPQASWAQEAVVLSVSPTLFEMSANPGQTWSSSVRVINANPFPMTVYVEPVNFAPMGEDGRGALAPVLTPTSDGSTLAEWISASATELTIPAEQTVAVPFSITVPPEAAPGGHFAALLVGTRQLDTGGQVTQVETSQVVTSLVFLRVTGEVIETAAIREFRPSQRVFESTAATLALRFENTGTVHVRPQGEIELFNMWGQPRGVIPVNQNSQFGNVLPDSIRTYRYDWTGDFSLADIGRYRVEATLAYGDSNRQFVDATTYFWVIPWKWLLVLGVLLAAFVVVVVASVRLYVRRMMQLAGVTPELHRSTPTRAISLAAPVEAGILDLRQHLSGDGPLWQRLWQFSLRYRSFLVLGGALVVFVGLFLWYAILLVQHDFSYEVQYEQPNGTTVPLVTASSTALPAGTVADVQLVAPVAGAPAVVALAEQLTQAGFTVTVVADPVTPTRERTVLVYDTAQEPDLFALQELLPPVLVSAFTVAAGDSPFTLYVGADILTP